MKDKNNDNIINEKEVEIKKNKEEKDISFLQKLLVDSDILYFLKESISNQKKFISFIINQLKKLKNKYQKKEKIEYNEAVSKKYFYAY